MIVQPVNNLPQTRPFTRSWQFWLGLVVSLACLMLALQGINLKEVIATLGQVDGWLMLLALMSVLATFTVKAVRWKLLLKDAHPTFSQSFSIQSIGMLLNIFAPARLGDLARAYLMGEALHTSKVYVLGTIVIEKIFDLIFLLLCLIWVVSQVALPAWLTSPALRLSVTVSLIVILVGLLAWKRREIASLVGSLAGHLPGNWSDWLVQRIGSGLESLEVFQQLEQLVGVIAWTILIGLLSVSTNMLVFKAVGMQVSIWAGVLLLVVLQVGVAVPSSPGRIGIFHYLVVLTLLVFGVGHETALGCAVMLYLVVIAPIGIVGAIFLWSEKVTWDKLKEAAAQLNGIMRRTA
jgi:glycosyltransferase 2 family protein